jgi:transposase InsO family protein
VNPNPFSLTTLVQDLVDELNILAIEYNFNRPHQSLGCLAPVEYIEKELAKYAAQCYYVVS